MRPARWMYVVVFALACNRPDQSEFPAILSVTQQSFTTLPSQGSNSTAISELWFYSDGDILGVVDTPATLPLLKEGSQTITIFAGIKNNGMGTSRIRYPFYAGFDTTLEVTSGNTYKLLPHFTYIDNAAIDATRNFESGNSFVAASSNDGNIELLNDPALAASGVRCVRLKLPAGNSILSYLDETNIALTPGNVAFLEMDYSCNNTFVVGVYVISGGNTSKVPVLYLTPTQEDGTSNPKWNKIYMDLGMIASQNVSADNYRLYVESTAQEATEPLIYLDDIKIVK
jgi:hypothetical protein